MRLRGPVTRRPATAAVEMAFVLPFMVFFLIGIWDVGRLAQVHQAIDNACREGARQASTGKYTISEVEASVRYYLGEKGAGLKVDSEVKVTVKNNTVAGNETLAKFKDDGTRETGFAFQGDEVQVDVEYPFKHVRWIGINTFLSNSTKIFVTSKWTCMADLPVIVPQNVPTKPYNDTNPF